MDASEFDEFYSASFRRVTGQVYAMIGDLDEATECTQEAFARAWARGHSGVFFLLACWLRTLS